MALLPAIGRTEGASPFARRSRHAVGTSFDEMLAPRQSLTDEPKSLRRPQGLRRPLRDKDEAVRKASEQLQNNRVRRQEYKKTHSGSMRDEKACVVKSLSLTGGASDAVAAGCLLPQLAATPQCFRYLQNLNLSGTRVTSSGVKSLSTFLGCGEDCHVKALRLDRCGLSDASSALLFRGVEKARCLKVMSLAKNRVGAKGCVALAKSIKSTHLKELNLSGNALHGLALGFLCEALAYNTTIQRLDLSWNLLGKATQDFDRGDAGEAPPALRALSACVAINRHLKALNLANCSLDLACIECLAEGLRENTTLISLLVNEGNCGKLDAKMFLEIDAPSQLGDKKVVDRGHRWSEPGYREVEFLFTETSCAALDLNKPLYLHLQCDNWRADEVELEDSGFVRYRVLPPGRNYYFFSQGDEVLIADDHLSEIHPKVHCRRNFVETTPGHLLKSVSDLDGARPRDQDWSTLETAWLVARPPAWSIAHAFVGKHRQLCDAEKQDLKATKADPRLFELKPPDRSSKTSQNARMFDPDAAFRDYELFDGPGRLRAASFEDWTDMKLTKLRLVPEVDKAMALDGLRRHYVLLAALFQHLRCVEYPNHRTELRDSVDWPTMLKLLLTTGLVVPTTRVQTPLVTAGGAKAYKGSSKKKRGARKSLGVDHSSNPIDTKQLRELFYIVNVSFEEHMVRARRPPPAFPMPAHRSLTQAAPEEKELLDRGEFIELLCRLALLRYADPSEPDGLELAASLDLLVEHHIGPYVDHVAKSSSLVPDTIGRNDGFRIKFFYTPSTDAVLGKYEAQLRRLFREFACGQHAKDPFGAAELKRQKALKKKLKKPSTDIYGRTCEEDEILIDQPRIAFADLLELIVRTGALDVDYLRPKKQPPSDGLGRGRITEYNVLCDATKSEFLSIDDKGKGAADASLDLGEFLEYLCRHVWRLHTLEGASHSEGLAHYHVRLDEWLAALFETLYYEDVNAELRARYVRGALPPTPEETTRPEPALLDQVSAMSVASKLAGKFRRKNKDAFSVDTFAFAPPEDAFEDDDGVAAVPRDEGPRPDAAQSRRHSRRRKPKKHAYQTNPYALPVAPRRQGRRDKPKRRQQGPTTFDDFFAEGEVTELPAHSPIRTPNGPRLPAASNPRTPGSGLKERVEDDEDDEASSEEEEYEPCAPLTAAADPRTPGGGLKTLSEEDFDDEDDDSSTPSARPPLLDGVELDDDDELPEELDLTPVKPVTAHADPRTPGGGLRAASLGDSYDESYDESGDLAASIGDDYGESGELASVCESGEFED